MRGSVFSASSARCTGDPDCRGHAERHIGHDDSAARPDVAECRHGHGVRARADAAGNQSATFAPTNTIIKDIVAAAPSDAAYRDNVSALGGKDDIYGTSECGATITAVKTVGGSTTFTSPVLGASGAFDFQVSAQTLSAYSYNVTATDRAGNTSTIVVVSGSAFL